MSVRLALVYAGLLALALLVASGVAWVTTKSVAENETRDRIALELDALQDEFSAEGIKGVVTTILSREHNPGALEYRLLDPSARLLGGSLELKHSEPGWHILDLPAAGTSGHRDYVILITRLQDGSLLTIGENLAWAEQIQNSVLEAFAWVGLAAVLTLLAAGAFVAWGTLRRVDALSDTMKRVGAGDLAARAPARKNGDDVDRIGSGVNEMLEQINLLVADVKRVSADIAHDLRTPLAHLQQTLETAATRTDIAAAREDMKAAMEKVADILHIFDAMLRLSAIEAGGGKARFSDVDVSEVVERVTDAYRPDIESTGQALEVSVASGTRVRGDAGLIAQALANLIENAMKHAGAAAAIRVDLLESRDGVRLEVADSGPGIPTADQARVLRPFERLDASRTSRGAGLGLSIVQAISRLHCARLALESAQPGLRVSMTWPTSRASE